MLADGGGYLLSSITVADNGSPRMRMGLNGNGRGAARCFRKWGWLRLMRMVVVGYGECGVGI